MTNGAEEIVSVCVATYRRPTLLRCLLESLSVLEFKFPPPMLHVLVVDNDINQSAHSVIQEFKEVCSTTIRYVCEPEQGIAAARNRALDMVPEDCDWIAFIDDDEVAGPNWLQELLSVRDTYHADVVAGPVTPTFPEKVASWIVAGGFFGPPPERSTGTTIEYCYTGSVLFHMHIVREGGIRFSRRYDRIGGEDTHFFALVHQAGYSMVWAQNAQVYEHVPFERLTRRYIFLRSFRFGVSLAMVQRDLYGRRHIFPLVVRGLIEILQGGTMAVGGAVMLNRMVMYLGADRLVEGVGILWQVCGGRFELYASGEGNNNNDDCGSSACNIDAPALDQNVVLNKVSVTAERKPYVE